MEHPMMDDEVEKSDDIFENEVEVISVDLVPEDVPDPEPDADDGYAEGADQ